MRQRQIIYWLALALIAISLIAWQWEPAHRFSWKYDEGLNAVKAQLLLAGKPLYREIWSDQPPLFTLLLAASFKVWGQSVLAGRALVLGLTVVGIAALGWLARRLAGPWAGVAAAFCLAILPHVHELSRLIMIGLPAISLGLVALACAWEYRAASRHAWLVASALTFAASLLVKPLTAPLYLPLSALILAGGASAAQIPSQRPGFEPPWGRHRVAANSRNWLQWNLYLALPLLLTVIAFGPSALAGQIVGTLADSRAASGFDLAGNWSEISAYLFNDKWSVSYSGLIALGVVGLAALARERRWPDLLALSLWLVGTFAALVLHSPLRRHQLLLFTPALIAAAAVSVGQALGGLFRLRKIGASARVMAFAAWAALALALMGAPDVARADLEIRDTFLRDDREALDRRGAVEYLQRYTPPGSVVITDDPMLAFKSGRLVPPALAVPSARRVEAGELSAAALISLTENVQPSAILLWEQRLAKVEEYNVWVRTHYTAVRAYSDARWIYAPAAIASVQHPQPAVSEEGLAFVGSRLARPAADPGETLALDIYLRADRSIERDYTLFVHLVDAEGHSWGQQDTPPLDGQDPTSAWQLGEGGAQHVELTVRDDAPPGDKLLAVGLYGADKRRLTFYDGQGAKLPDGQLILAPHAVVRWKANYDAPVMQHTEPAELGGQVRLLGCDLGRDAWRAGETLSFTLYWQSMAEMNTNYTVFVHLLDDRGEIAAQRDQQPGAGEYPTAAWRAGEVIADRYEMPLPANLAPGEYHLAVGMYELASGARLPMVAGGQTLADGRLTLTVPIRIE